MSRLARAFTAARDFFYEAAQEAVAASGAEPTGIEGSAEPEAKAVPDTEPFSPVEQVEKIRELVGDDYFALHPVTPEQVAVAQVEKSLGDVPQMPRTKPTDPVGASGLGVIFGHVTDNEKAPELRGAARYRTYENAKREVAEVGIGVRDWLLLSGAPGWTVKPYKADDADEPTPEDEERAAWAQRQLHGMHTKWQRVVMEHSLAPIDGSRIAVKTAKLLPPGTIVGGIEAIFGLDDVMTIPLSTIDRWDIDTSTGRLRGIVQLDPDTSQEIPIARERLVYTRDLPTTTHPAGDGVLRFLAETIRRLQKLETLLDKSFERDVNGIPILYGPVLEKQALIGNIPEGWTRVYTRADFDREMKDAVAFVSADKRKDAGIILDSSPYKNRDGTLTSVRKFAAEVLTAQATSHAELRARIKDLAWNILAMIGCEHKAMGRDSGTQALHASKERGQIRGVSSFLNGFAEVAQYDLIRWLWVLNGFDPANPDDPQNLPTLCWNALEFVDTGAVVQSVSTLLTAAGVVEPERVLKIVNAILDNYGLPALESLDPEGVARAREDALDRAGMGRATDPDDELDDLDLDVAPGGRKKGKA